jgi:aryl-alcohol dehydrogenase-like predicted oxidoreductase
VIPAAMNYGVGIIPWSPLFRGLLGGILAKQISGGRSASEQTQKLLATHRGNVERYEALCTKLGEHPAAVGLAWLLQRPGVTAPIVGPRTPEQFQSNLHALDVELSVETLAELDAIFPGPGTAPEAWAW